MTSQYCNASNAALYRLLQDARRDFTEVIGQDIIKKMGMTEVEDHLLSYMINITCRVKILCAFQNKKKKLHASSSAEPSSGESSNISGSSRNSLRDNAHEEEDEPGECLL